ncbi:GAF domain protein [Atopobium sp. ICM42b]|uniref:GAF domain-containing protein n=1 Tax=Atopobium sp. ICM42b TaxID=1190620 RepID=UPI00044695B9|nr:GAF domain-containing protein [Atopobium sp. ICM42b]EWC96033.1 GAF domain protein [Atopobium sp. ICM42b]
MIDYGLLAKQIVSLAEVDAHWLPVLSNAAALLWDALDDINWAGFYLVDPVTVTGVEPDAGLGVESDLDLESGAALSAHEPRTPELRLGPFQGKVACVRIPFGRGVCGTAAATKTSQLVEDVHQFPGHIACDSASNSEVVVPIVKDNQVVGVLDIDSPSVARFTQEDLAGLEQVVKVLESCANFSDFC